MEQKTLAHWLEAILIGISICGILIYAMMIPAVGISLRTMYPEFANRFWPWLGFIWATGIPCVAALVFAWRISKNIGRNRSFSMDNARFLKNIAVLAAGDAGFFFFGNVILLMLNMSHPGVTLASLIIVFAGAAVSVASAALSHLVKKAAELQEQSDLTI